MEYADCGSLAEVLKAKAATTTLYDEDVARSACHRGLADSQRSARPSSTAPARRRDVCARAGAVADAALGASRHTAHHSLGRGHDPLRAGSLGVSRRRLPAACPQVVLDWLVQIVAALRAMHSRSILHRDLKAANVFLTSRNLIKVGDFGISKMLEKNDGLASTTIGTPYYLAPEAADPPPAHAPLAHPPPAHAPPAHAPLARPPRAPASPTRGAPARPSNRRPRGRR